jgi:hypothetical protein
MLQKGSSPILLNTNLYSASDPSRRGWIENRNLCAFRERRRGELQALAMFGALLPMCSFLLLCEEG